VETLESFKKTVGKYLEEVEQARGKENKKSKALELFQYMVRPSVLKITQKNSTSMAKFRKTVAAKVQEFADGEPQWFESNRGLMDRMRAAYQ
jgi:hypothetical protein